MPCRKLNFKAEQKVLRLENSNNSAIDCCKLAMPVTESLLDNSTGHIWIINFP